MTTEQTRLQMDATAYDLVVIGSGPAGQKGAITAAQIGKRVAVVVEKQKRSLWVARDGKAQKVEVSVGVNNGVEADYELRAARRNDEHAEPTR